MNIETPVYETPTESLLPDAFLSQLKAAEVIFNERVFESHPEHGSLMCSIHAAYEPPGQIGHNCLGCNFDDLTSQMSDFLKVANNMRDQHHVFFIFAMIANGIWERMRDIFDIVGVPETYREQNFKPFYRVRRWANFFKHPKSFSWLIHHPRFITDGSEIHKKLIHDNSHLFVDDNFVKRHYISATCKVPDKDFEKHRETTVVVLPNIENLTNNLCYCMEHFVELVTKNPVYVSMLSDKATILYHYDKEYSEPLDWSYEADKEKAAPSKLDGISSEELESGYKAIDEKYVKQVE